VSVKKKVSLRNPGAMRPWQHVLEPLSGYLLLGRRLLEGGREFAEAWNFGPHDASALDVEAVLAGLKTEWDDIEYEIDADAGDLHEAGLLKLDCSKARAKLKWEPVWDIHKTLAVTARWYKKFYEKGLVASIEDIREYMTDAEEKRPLQRRTGQKPFSGPEDRDGPGK
jgi:CDP-glucose 4,6-dehydratase